ncbi:SMP-30/gluconolactonase/LRE family protein [Bacillus sp. SPARC3]|uniref:SMP-30/gluconolactonase/LRE family protein n=1 Tax=Bacillus sp. SPARC3 TaxID=2841275 RepID=UPI001C933A8D|nr:SMP-30/gluconolactonase/LRE family protein [Bacillus sp. SPARC3]MBY4602323.1 SMP-30/gluconolactonase/LRE family protein [Bacillus sp. SPARC3]
MDAVLEADTRAVIGEGPLWDEENGRLYWVDILGSELHIFDPEEKINRSVKFKSFVTALAKYTKDKLIMTMKDGFYLYHLQDDSLEKIKQPKDMDESLRFNDAKCDPYGRLWAGTMSMEGEQKQGSLYRLDPDGRLIKMKDQVSTSNGLDWDRERNLMYYIDTPTQEIVRYSYNPESGDVSNPEPVYRFEQSEGLPDGMTIDQNGMLWVALFGGSRVVQIDPFKKKEIDSISVPAKYVTCCAFGGRDLKTLYITTATEKMTEKERYEQPHAGGLFSAKLETGGYQPVPFAGNV